MTVSKDKTASKTSTKTTSNGNGKTAASTKTASSNGKTASSKTSSNGKTASSKTTAKAPEVEEELSPDQLVKRIRGLIHKKYSIVLPRRNESAEVPVYYAAKEQLERAINTALKKAGKSPLDWNEWNTRVAPALLGQPGKLKYDPLILAPALAQLFPGISLDPVEAVKDLCLYNERSLDKRNNRSKPEPEPEADDDDFDLDSLDELDEDDSDSDDESDSEDEDDDLEDEEEDEDEDDDLE